jgi:hypothetical protein
MLSWILASASTTPNAPAEQSQTMVTGRVCKNILGLFSNGIKETLEVKLKLVPVPTCLQSEYVENMERYHNLSKVLPEGLPDYNAWAQFLDANPAIRQLALPTPINPTLSIEPSQMGGLESVHNMLARQSPSDNALRFDSFLDQQQTSFDTYDTRASSPAMSMASLYQYPFHQDTRPDSRASFHSDITAYPQQYHSPVDSILDQPEEGPPRKRARITQAKRPKKTALGVNNDSLRVTASTAASVRLHKPAASHAGAAVSIEQVPRAPTPRPDNSLKPNIRGPFRPVAPSMLRHASIDGNRPYVSPYESGLYSDAALDSADDERAGSPGDTPLNMPSSPPVMPLRTASSSPDLPSLPLPNDSGFVSDVLGSREDEEMRIGKRLRAESSTNIETALDTNDSRTVHARSQSVQSVPDTRRHAGDPTINASTTLQNPRDSSLDTVQQDDDSLQRSVSTTKMTTTDSAAFSAPSPVHPLPNISEADSELPNSSSISCKTNNDGLLEPSGLAKEAPVAKQSRPVKAKGLERSHTWSGEPMSDAGGPTDRNSLQPRSGSGAKRKHIIKDQLEKALELGQMPQYCNNCGQIETPAWRRAYTRIEYGSPAAIQLSSKGTSICAWEILEPEEDGDSSQRYRIFKQALAPEETKSKTFTTLTLCNPCGLWLGKRNSMRPNEVWAKAQANAQGNAEKPKRKRKPRKPKGEIDNFVSDAVVPDSEGFQPDIQDEAKPLPALDGTDDTDTNTANPSLHPLPQNEVSSPKPTNEPQLDKDVAQAALARAIQSSPVGLRGTDGSPIDVEGGLTPKPTRRLLFPSPRGAGQVKSLGDVRPLPRPTVADADINTTKDTVQLLGTDEDSFDKENCPPSANDEDDGLSHLFDDHGSARTTSTKGKSPEDLLKTPTPASRRRVPLTPKPDVLGLTTPSRVTKTPQTVMRAATIAPETPFTRQLNALLSDCMASSPSQAIDFSAFQALNTPGRTHSTSADFGDLLSNDLLSSDMLAPSSPSDALNFSVFEDPNTSTVGLWSGASIFEGSDPAIPEADEPEINMIKVEDPEAD